MMCRSSSVWMILILLMASGQWQCRKPGAEGSPGAGSGFISELVVKAVPVVRRQWSVAVPITGNLHSLSMVDVKPEVNGRLIETYFEEGDLVRKGQVLAEIDPVNYRLDYDRAEAALRVAEAGLDRAKVSADHARNEKERADNLVRSGGITEKDHDAAITGIRDAETQVRLAEAQCAQARAALAIAEKALKDCRIISPAEGHIQKKYFDKGSLLAAGTPLYTLVDNNRLELECVIPSYQLANLRLGQHATFQTPTWGDLRFAGIVSAISPEVESDNRAVALKLRIANQKGQLRSGMYAKGEIVTGTEPQALVIPRDCLIPEKEGANMAGVYVVREGKAHRVDIVIGDSQQEYVWVQRGLQEGELVITEIGPSLKEGVIVRLR